MYIFIAVVDSTAISSGFLPAKHEEKFQIHAIHANYKIIYIETKIYFVEK